MLEAHNSLNKSIHMAHLVIQVVEVVSSKWAKFAQLPQLPALSFLLIELSMVELSTYMELIKEHCGWS